MGVSFFWDRDDGWPVMAGRRERVIRMVCYERESPHNSNEAGPSCDCRKSFSCLVLRPLTRLRQRRKLEGFSSRRISLISSASTKPVFRRISSKVVRSSQAMRMSELFSWGESRESETFLFLGTSYRGADSRGGQWKYLIPFEQTDYWWNGLEPGPVATVIASILPGARYFLGNYPRRIPGCIGYSESRK